MFKKLMNWIFSKKPKQVDKEDWKAEHIFMKVLEHADNKIIVHLWLFDLKNKKKISTRLYNSLYKYFKNDYLEDITIEEFMQYRGHGFKAWEEFSTLRNKYLKTKRK